MYVNEPFESNQIKINRFWTLFEIDPNWEIYVASTSEIQNYTSATQAIVF